MGRNYWMAILVGCLSLSAGTPASNLTDLARHQGGKTPFWLVLDDAGGALAREFRDVIANDEEDRLNLPITVIPASEQTTLDPRLARQAGGKRPRWALLSPAGEVLTCGCTAPSPSALLDAARGVGFHSPVETIDAFLLAHPDHVEAVEEALILHLALARHRLENARKGNEKAAGPSGPESAGGGPLSEKEDVRIWGKAAGLLERYVASGDFHIHGLRLYQALPEEARRSPCMAAAARKSLPAVEDWLHRNPQSAIYWNFWATLNSWTQFSRSVSHLDLESSLLPGKRVFYPAEALKAINRELEASQDWKGIVRFLQPVWDFERDNETDWKPEPGGKEYAEAMESTWACYGPLIKAYLHLADPASATRTVLELVQHSGFREMAQKASALARSMNHGALARQWAEIQPTAETPAGIRQQGNHGNRVR